LSRCGDEALRGAIFIDPTASSPYLFHLVQVFVERRQPLPDSADLLSAREREQSAPSDIVESRLLGIRQESNGAIALCPVEHLLLLRGAQEAAPGSVPLAGLARGLTEAAAEWLRNHALAQMVEEHRARIMATLPDRLDWVMRGYDHKTAELVAKRQRLTEEARSGDPRAKAELTRVKEQQRQLSTERDLRLAQMRADADLILPGGAVFAAHALVLPSADPEERERHDAEVEAIAMRLARAHEEARGAIVHDVSGPELARRAGLPDWPGFDLRSLRPASAYGPAEELAIEVKGRAASGGVEVSENEWAKACNLRDRYWLYVVFDCATPRPRLVKVQDPFSKLLARAKGSVLIADTEILTAAHRD
jgi:hypothetical protein